MNNMHETKPAKSAAKPKLVRRSADPQPARKTKIDAEPVSALPIAPSYGQDLFERWIIFLDTLRQRADNTAEHERQGMPPLLDFKYETILDARGFEQPANYALLRITEVGDDCWEDCVDETKPPVVVADPRAGHGPGIGGFKHDSEIGMAMHEGHPVYFVMFYPEPMPQQTLSDVHHALRAFVAEVARRHPNTPPVLYGNCQAGWALTLLAADCAGLTGPVVLNGSPLSYWAGEAGSNPMRVMGGLSGAMPSSSAFDYSKIRSIAVLTLVDENQGSAALDRTGMPLGGRSINPGEALAAALVNQLSKVDSLEVRPYRPLTAESESDFYRLSSELDVKAFVTGTFGMQASASGPVWVMRWKLVGQTGHELTSGTYIKRQVPNQLADQMLAQQEVASQIAQEIDRILVKDPAQPPPQVYACLVKGHAQADTDSTEGLREALACYSHALENNPTQIEPLAAQAVTMLTLAARSDRDESIKLIGDATQSMKEAIGQDPTSMNARLAQAIIEWQRLSDFQKAYDLFEQLLLDSPYQWSVHHQFGLLLETIGQDSRAQNLLQRASKLNSLSMLVRTDLVRVKWFNGYTVHSADREAVFLKGIPKPGALIAKFGNPATKWVEGLLIDVLEEQRAYQKVGELLRIDQFENNERSYFRWRAENLSQHPYGPFGDVLNQAILDSRRNDRVDPGMIGVMNEANALMFPLLFARHPAMRGLRALPDAKDFLPATPETFLLDPANRT